MSRGNGVFWATICSDSQLFRWIETKLKMPPRQRRSTLFPLILLSYSLACSGFETIPAGLPASVETYTSQKQALISPPDLFDTPAMKTYLHPSNIFSYDAPIGWDVNVSLSGVQIYSPTSIVLFISSINTGYDLSTSSFIQLASNIEHTQYAEYDQYQVIAHQEDRLHRVVFIEKTYLQNDIRRTSISIYRQIGHYLYIVEMSGDRAEITASHMYEALFFAFNESIEALDPVGLTSVPYIDTWTFTQAQDHFSMDIPLGWLGPASEMQGNVVRTQFHAPDGNAVIDHVFWDQDEVIKMNAAAGYAFKLLSDYVNGTDDIKVTSEIILENGKKEKITWVSRSGGYAGVVYIEVRNRMEVFILSFTWNRLFDDIYGPVMETTAATYESPLFIE
jgi:hypothetical protein